METLKGKTAGQLAAGEILALTGSYSEIWLDLGTGDGQFVRLAARQNPSRLVIGLDACRENLRESSRKAPPNALFVIANAFRLPDELAGIADRLMVNFPWGSLLAGLLAQEAGLPEQLRKIARPGTILEIRLNASALHEAGWELEPGARQVSDWLAKNGWRITHARPLDQLELRLFPSSWAKRLAYGAIKTPGFYLRAILPV
jgi:16S rRNA (adenine(1408)-N(1))-methyltransferase